MSFQGATAERVSEAERDPKVANAVYHDWEASTYDDKWSISFDERCIAYARDRFLRVAPERSYPRVLEIGCGTGFFIVNLWQAGLAESAYACDISLGMTQACRRNGNRVGLEVAVTTADAECLPYADASFDLVIGHAVLHHLPDVPAALREARRVLRPGGALVVAGEPTRLGHALVGLARRGSARVFKTLAAVLPGEWLARSGPSADPEAALEAHVDLHEFHPHDIREAVHAAGFRHVRVRTEELVSGLFGWSVRTIEALAAPGRLGEWWPHLAYRGYVALHRLDDSVVRRIVPAPLFYNLLLYAERPPEPPAP